MPATTLWATVDRTHHFLIPEDADLPPGDLIIRTPTGRERQVEESPVARYEVSEAEAKAWTEEQLSATFGEMRGKAEALVERLRTRTAQMREENRKAWQEGMAEAPPEVQEATERLRTGLRDLGQTIQRLARENLDRPAPEGTPDEGAGDESPPTGGTPSDDQGTR